MGAAVFVMPVVQKLHRLDLSSREIPVAVTAAVSAQGIRCDADAVAIVKVGGTAEMIRPAAQRFLVQQNRIEARSQPRETPAHEPSGLHRRSLAAVARNFLIESEKPETAALCQI